LIALDPAYELHQVKQKFGGLRFYASFRDDVAAECSALIADAEMASLVTCERCGDPGQLRHHRNWRITLCDACDALVGPTQG
jgi:hypothetical protein